MVLLKIFLSRQKCDDLPADLALAFGQWPAFIDGTLFVCHIEAP